MKSVTLFYCLMAGNVYANLLTQQSNANVFYLIKYIYHFFTHNYLFLFSNPFWVTRLSYFNRIIYAIGTLCRYIMEGIHSIGISKSLPGFIHHCRSTKQEVVSLYSSMLLICSLGVMSSIPGLTN